MDDNVKREQILQLLEYQETYRSIQDEKHLLSEPLIILLVRASTVFCHRVVNAQARRSNEFHNKGDVLMVIKQIVRPEEVGFELDCLVLSDLALLVPDLGGDAFGERHHWLGHVDQHIKVLEGIGVFGLVFLVLL